MKHGTKRLLCAAALASAVLLAAACQAPAEEAPAESSLQESVGQASVPAESSLQETASEAPPETAAYEVRELRLANGKNDGTVYGELYLPAGADGELPAVILSHSAGLTADSLRSYAVGFAERGYAAYAFDFCGGSADSRSDGDAEEMTVFTEVGDLEAVLSQLGAMDGIDGERIFLFGTSQGGLVSALAASDCADRVAGLMLLYPAFNIPELAQKALGGSASGIDWRSMLSGFSRTVCGEDFLRTLEGFDVYAHIGGFDGRVILLHGERDWIVDPSYSERAQAVYGADRCELHLLPGAMHGFNRENYAFADYDAQVWAYLDAWLP